MRPPATSTAETCDTRLRTAALTAFAMTAFAANSLLCRLAVGEARLDPLAFTSIRVVCGAATLTAISVMRGQRPVTRKALDWRGIAALDLYLICFALAYRWLGAATGAMILFAAVQFTMMLADLRTGRPATAWLGLVLAFAGLAYFMRPSLSAPDPVGALLMGLAGAGWGVYTLRGRRAQNPLASTTASFLLSVPPILLIELLEFGAPHLPFRGVVLAAASGALASACGYVAWYAALPQLRRAQAAVVQLCVPLIAAAGAVILLGEPASLRFALATAAVLGGVGMSAATSRGARGRPQPSGF
jgi:drug/metabolite transporter (DMT)-like permease